MTNDTTRTDGVISNESSIELQVYFLCTILLLILNIIPNSYFVHKTRKLEEKWLNTITNLEDLVKKNLFIYSTIVISTSTAVIVNLLIMILASMYLIPLHDNVYLYVWGQILEKFELIWLLVFLKTGIIATNKDGNRVPSRLQQVLEPLIPNLLHIILIIILYSLGINRDVIKVIFSYLVNFLYFLVIVFTVTLLCKMNSPTTKLCGFIGLMFCIFNFPLNIWLILVKMGITYAPLFEYHLFLYFYLIFFSVFPVLPFKERFEYFENRSQLFPLLRK